MARTVFSLMFLGVLGLLIASAQSEDEPAAEQSPATPTADPAKPAAETAEETEKHQRDALSGESEPDDCPYANDETEKHQRALIGLMALCGILIGGLGFLAVVMIWGARLRRMARRELPPQKTLQNELWFLKPPKSPPE